MSSDEKIRKAYYDEGNLFGRDALFHLLKKKYPKSHPSKNEIEAWLGKQELQQLHKQTRKGGATDRFRPSKPWDNISMDLIDYSGRSAPNGKKYILVVVDNFSRFVLVRPMLNKEAKTTARHLTSILDEIKKLTKGVDIKNIITDDGSEFKGETSAVLKKRGIGIRRALGGNPQQNGIVERANGKIKNLIKKNMDISGGSWSTHLKKSADAYNRQFNRGIGFSPDEAVKLSRTEQEQVKVNVKEAYGGKKEVGIDRDDRTFEVGDDVRVKLNKSKLSKGSDDNWSKTLYKIGKVTRKQGTRAERYRLVKKAKVSEDTIYTRNDLQKVDVNTLEKIPTKQKKATRAQVEKDKDESGIGARVRKARRRLFS